MEIAEVRVLGQPTSESTKISRGREAALVGLVSTYGAEAWTMKKADVNCMCSVIRDMVVLVETSHQFSGRSGPTSASWMS